LMVLISRYNIDSFWVWYGFRLIRIDI
jgi:hypothetical protein